VPLVDDLYAKYHPLAWQIARERIGQDLRERYELSQELPLRLLGLLRQLDKRSADLALAASHVERGRIIVARQRELVTRLKALGCSTFDHECSLRVFATTLETFVAHERALRKGPGASAKLVAQLRRQRSNYAGLDVR